MLKINPGRTYRFAGLAIAGGMSLAGVVLAVPDAAHEEPAKEQVIEKKVIVRNGPNGNRMVEGAEPGDHRAARQQMRRREGRNCRPAAAAPTRNGDQAGHLRREGRGSAGLADALTKAMARIDAENSDLDPKVKADLKAKMEAKIRDLRAKG